MPKFEPGQRVYSYRSDEYATVVWHYGFLLSLIYEGDTQQSIRKKAFFVLADGSEQRHHERCVRPVL